MQGQICLSRDPDFFYDAYGFSEHENYTCGIRGVNGLRWNNDTRPVRRATAVISVARDCERRTVVVHCVQVHRLIHFRGDIFCPGQPSFAERGGQGRRVGRAGFAAAGGGFFPRFPTESMQFMGLGGEGTLLEGRTLGFRRGGQGGRTSVSFVGTDEFLLVRGLVAS